MRRNDSQGNVLLIVMVFFVMISLSISLGLVAPVLRAERIAQSELESKRSYFASESGVEDVMYRVKNSKAVSASETLIIGAVSATTTITDQGNGDKVITSEGNSHNRERTVSVTLAQGNGVEFNYGLQVGRGGIYLDGSSGINGSVYVNGDIYGTSSAFITGSAVAANSPALTADQQNGSGTPASSIVFGNASSTQDFAQSFTVASEAPLNKVQFYIKKTGSPSNATVYLMKDSNGTPGTTYVASGTLSASNVGTGYGWVDVTFTTQPTLQTNTTYWVVIDASTSSTKYYTIGANTNGYTSGVAKVGQRGGSWSAVSPATLDGFFKLYIGGQASIIYGDSQYNQLHIGTGGTGSATARNVQYVNATGAIYCQSGTGNNKTCDTSQDDPAPLDWPVSNSNIDDWKAEAVAGGTQTGNVDAGSGWQSVSLGPKKIVGNLNVGGSATLTVTGTLWVTGNLTIGGSGKVQLSSAYGAQSGTIIVDGTVSISGSSPVTGSGTSGSYILIVSNSDCPTSSTCGSTNAVTVSGAAGAVVLIAQNGTISFSGSASAKQATGYRVALSGGATVSYESGLANLSFSGGPSGAWNVSSWKETQ